MIIKDTSESWETLSTRRPFQGAKTAVDSDEVRMPDGSTARRDYQVHPGSVCVLALDEEGRVLVLSQYRHPVRRRLWELPAGLLDVPGENPLVGAQRELYEEAHVKAEDWRVLVDFYASPGGSDEAIRVFLARGVSEADGERYSESGSEEADMEVTWVPLAELARGSPGGRARQPGAGSRGAGAVRRTRLRRRRRRPAPGPRPVAGPPVRGVAGHPGRYPGIPAGPPRPRPGGAGPRGTAGRLRAAAPPPAGRGPAHPGRPARRRRAPQGKTDHLLIRLGDFPAALHTGRRSA